MIQNKLNSKQALISSGKGMPSLKEGKKYTKAQLMAKRRLAQKSAGTYQKPKTAQELAKDRLKIKADKLKKSTKKRNRVR